MRTHLFAFALLSLATPLLAEPVPTLSSACAGDHARVCTQSSVNSDGAARCLRDHYAEVSRSCQMALDAKRERMMSRVRMACSGEIRSYCSHMRDSSSPVSCLHMHDNGLTKRCRAALPRRSS